MSTSRCAPAQLMTQLLPCRIDGVVVAPCVYDLNSNPNWLSFGTKRKSLRRATCLAWPLHNGQGEPQTQRRLFHIKCRGVHVRNFLALLEQHHCQLFVNYTAIYAMASVPDLELNAKSYVNKEKRVTFIVSRKTIEN